jgi:SAM-dependent methyltransferase
MSRVSFRTLWREAARGKSIGRILANETLRRWGGQIRGVVLDLACGREPSYWRVLELGDNEQVRLVGVDYNLAFRPAVVADLTRPLPFKDGVADGVIASSFLCILPDPGTFLGEVQRVLKPGGWLLLTAPLIFPYNPEPTDYWRFTEEALRLLLRHSGFVGADITPFGGRFSAAAYLLSPFLRPRWLVAPFVYWLCLKLDAWTKRFRLPECPIGYVAKARKP